MMVDSRKDERIALLEKQVDVLTRAVHLLTVAVATVATAPKSEVLVAAMGSLMDEAR